MAKRGIGEVTQNDLSKPLKLSKPSLDSDEEDYQGEECFRLREADIEGQENATLEYDGAIKITPFNMREELEEDGYFDGSGNFIFKKSEDTRDNWMEDIDWAVVSKLQQDKQKTQPQATDDTPTAPLGKDDKLELYSQMIKYMRRGETVLRSIKRMGAQSVTAKSASASQRWLKKKNTKTAPSEQAENGDPEGLVRATELADQLLQAGEFDVYQTTYEQIDEMLHKKAEAEPEDELDALGQALDVEHSENGKEKAPTNVNPQGDSEQSPVMWHLKRSEAADADLEGPYTSEQLKKWVQTSYFANTPVVLVRQLDRPNGPFYNINRIDFDLYE